MERIGPLFCMKRYKKGWYSYRGCDRIVQIGYFQNWEERDRDF